MAKEYDYEQDTEKRKITLKIKEENIGKILLSGVIIIFLLIIGLLIVSIQLKKTTNELDNVPCWNEVCEDKKVESGDYGLIVIKSYRYRMEEAYILKMTFSWTDLLTMSFIKEISNIQLNKMIENEQFDIETVYVELSSYDGNDEKLFTKKKGTKPVWLKT